MLGRYIDLDCPLESGHPLNQGLAACWLALPNNRGGTQLHDVVSGRYTLTGVNTPGWAGGPSPVTPQVSAVRLVSASSQHFSTANAVVTAYPFTLACWGRSTDATASQYAISIGTGTPDASLNWGGNAAGDPLRIVLNGSVRGVTSTGYTANIWQHGAAVFESSTSRAVYLDGGSKGIDTASVTFSSPAASTRVGQAYSGASYFAGDIADARIYSRALSDSEVFALYEEGRRGWPTVLRRYSHKVWLFGSDIGGGTFTASGTLTIGAATASGSATFSPGTKTASGTLTVAAATASGTATHTPPTFTASGTLTTPAATASGSATFDSGTFTASGTLTVAPATAAGSASFTAPVYTGSGTLTSPPATASGTAEFDAPVYTASGSLSITPAVLAGVGEFDAPVYTGSGTPTVAPATLTGTAIFATVVFQASGSLSVAPATATGTASHTTPTFTASGTLSVTPTVLAGTASHTAPTFTASGSLAAGPATLAGAAEFTTGTRTGSGVLTVAAATLSGTATFVAGPGYLIEYVVRVSVTTARTVPTAAATGINSPTAVVTRRAF